ncbi:MAG: DUF2807 domain-containing protein [Pseudomonadota bacterium]
MRTALGVRRSGQRDWLFLSTLTLVSVCVWTLLLAGRGAAAAEIPAAGVGFEQRDLGERLTAAFGALNLNGALDVDLHPGAHAGLQARGLRSDLDALRVSVADGDLRIGFAPGWSPRQRVTLALTYVALTRINGAGSITIRGDGLTGDALRLDLRGRSALNLDRARLAVLDVHTRGSAQLDVVGAADELRLSTAGDATMAAAGLATRVAELGIRGRGSVELAVAERLTVDIRGSGDIRYHGSPSVARVIRGHGSVRPADAAAAGAAGRLASAVGAGSLAVLAARGED